MTYKKTSIYFFIPLIFASHLHAGLRDYIDSSKRFFTNAIHNHPQLAATCAIGSTLAMVSLYKFIQYAKEQNILEKNCQPLFSELTKLKELASLKKQELGSQWNVAVNEFAVYKRVLSTESVEYKQLLKISDKKTISALAGITSALTAIVALFDILSKINYNNGNELIITKEPPVNLRVSRHCCHCHF